MDKGALLERLVVERFVLKSRQERYLSFMSSRRNRTKFLADLAHFRHFRSEMFGSVTHDEKTTVLAAIKHNGLSTAENCYLISENSALDKRFLEPAFALGQIIGYSMGTILVFGNAEMVYYEGEEPGKRLLSRRFNP